MVSLFREGHLKRKKSSQFRSEISKVDVAQATLALIGGLPLAGSGFEAEPGNLEFSERVLSIPEAES